MAVGQVRRIAMRASCLIGLILVMCALAACNLTTNPPTPTSPAFTQIPINGLSGDATPTPLFSSDLLTPPEVIAGSNPNCPPPPGWISYVVESGDTLTYLADATNTPIVELRTANCLDLLGQDSIFIDQILALPSLPQADG